MIYKVIFEPTPRVFPIAQLATDHTRSYPKLIIVSFARTYLVIISNSNLYCIPDLTFVDLIMKSERKRLIDIVPIMMLCMCFTVVNMEENYGGC